MGRVVVPMEVQNLEDYYQFLRGNIKEEQIRKVAIANALVDTGATAFSMPGSLIAKIGLIPVRTRKAMTATGLRDVSTFSAVRILVQGRECICDVTEIAEDCPPLLGQVPLELLDFLVDPGRQQLIANPAYGGQQVLELM